MSRRHRSTALKAVCLDSKGAQGDPPRLVRRGPSFILDSRILTDQFRPSKRKPRAVKTTTTPKKAKRNKYHNFGLNEDLGDSPEIFRFAFTRNWMLCESSHDTPASPHRKIFMHLSSMPISLVTVTCS